MVVEVSVAVAVAAAGESDAIQRLHNYCLADEVILVAAVLLFSMLCSRGGEGGRGRGGRR